MGYLNYTKCEEPIVPPCLMKNEFGEIFFVTEGVDNENYVTRISSDSEDVETWKSDLKGYKPLPAGAKFEFTN